MPLDLTTIATRFICIKFVPGLCSVSFSGRNNVSIKSNVLENGVKLSAWVDYNAVSKRLNVKLTKLGDPKPVESLISHNIDMRDIFKGEEVIASLALSNSKDHEESSTRFWSVFAGDSEKMIRGEEVLYEEFVN